MFAPIAAGVAGVAAPGTTPGVDVVAVVRGAPLDVSGVCEGIAPGDAFAGPPAVGV